MSSSQYDWVARSNDPENCLDCSGDPGLTDQSFKDSVNVNNILKKYQRNGISPWGLAPDAQYGDFSNIPSYAEALLYVKSADEEFMKLPSAVRTRFSNDPSQLLSFIQDPNNLAEAIKIGLVADPNAVEPPKVATPSPTSGGGSNPAS